MIESLSCPLGNSEADVSRALDEVETFAARQNLQGKKADHLRLLSEELLGMINHVVEVDEGRFFVEYDEKENKYEIHLLAMGEVGENAQKELVKASTEKKNAAYKGLTGLLNKVVDQMSDPTCVTYNAGYSMAPGADSLAGMSISADVINWSLEQYRRYVEHEEAVENYDELELSIITKLAEDVRVSARRDRVELVVIYKA